MVINLNNSFWKDKKVFITGHTGFKGSWMSLWLQMLGAKVTGYSLEPNTDPSLFDIANVSSGMNSIIGDIRDASALQKALSEAKSEILIHMAAQPLVRYSYLNPVETYTTNVIGTVNVLEAARKANSVRAIVNVTTDKCYENKEWLWAYRENEPMGGYDPYSSSKGCVELVTSAYRQSYFNKMEVAIASGRAGNVIGGGDWARDRLVPDIMRSIEDGIPVKIRNPYSVRPWQHVLEPISGYLSLAEKLFIEGSSISGGYNFGPNESDARPVQWIVEKIIKIWGRGAQWVIDEGEHLHEANYLKLDCSKAKHELGWAPRWSLLQALEKIVMWHKSVVKNINIKEVCINQITAYADLQFSNLEN